MSDELNPYPGNLKHHKVDAPARREPLLGDELIEAFNEDQYEQCASDWKMCEDASFHFTNGHLAGMREIIPHYEAARAKDAELIQRLVDGLKHAQRFAEEYGYGPLQTVEWDLEAAAAACFKPSNK